MEDNKVYCGCSPADMAAIVGANNNPLYSMLANRGRFGGDDDLLLILLLMGGGYGFGNNRTTPEIESLRNQIADNKNSSDLMAILNSNTAAIQQLSQMTNQSVDRVKDGLCAINAAVAKLSGDTGMGFERTINAYINGTKDMQATFMNCCCEQKMLIQQMSYEGQLRDQQNHSDTMSRIDRLAQGITEGFSATAYEAAKNATAIMANQDKNTQRILDQMCADKAQALRDLLAEKDRELLLYKLKAGDHDCNNCN